MTVVQIMEPTLIRSDNSSYHELSEQAYELSLKSAALGGSLPAGVVSAVGDLARSMNCYYSNLIEGQSTMPADIDEALRHRFHNDPVQRQLQEEALAHIEVQRWIDSGAMDEMGLGVNAIKEVHRRFYEAMPDRLHVVRNLETGKEYQVIPGEFRHHGVVVGSHIPCRPSDIEQLMARWESVYSELGRLGMVMALAAAHHRLVWIHPFSDGNGRVARLITHAMMRKCMIGAELWSVSRGFGRTRCDYLRLLSACDYAERGALHGRCRLSEQSLVDFTRYFLVTSQNQVKLMSEILQVDHFEEQLVRWVQGRERNSARAMENVLRYALVHGEVPRGKAIELIGLPERTGRRVVKTLLEKYELMSAETSRAPLKIHIPLALAQDLFPRLIPKSDSVS